MSLATARQPTCCPDSKPVDAFVRTDKHLFWRDLNSRNCSITSALFNTTPRIQKIDREEFERFAAQGASVQCRSVRFNRKIPCIRRFAKACGIKVAGIRELRAKIAANNSELRV